MTVHNQMPSWEWVLFYLTYHTEMNRYSWVRDGKSVQSFKKFIPLTFLKDIKGLSNKNKAEPLVRYVQGGLGT